MNFYNFTLAIVGIYICYYGLMVGYDMYLSGRNENREDMGEDIDISSSLNGYIPMDASEIVKNETQQNSPFIDIQVESDKVEEPTSFKGGGETGMGISKTNESGVEDIVRVNMCDSYSALELRELFEAHTGESFFRGILPATA